MCAARACVRACLCLCVSVRVCVCLCVSRGTQLGMLPLALGYDFFSSE